MICEQLASVLDNISKACARAQRNHDEVTLIGVSKYANVDQTREAIEAGLKHIGENRVQEADQKFEALGNAAGQFIKHMIGHLQTNKVKRALEIFDFIQSVDSLKLAYEIEEQAEKMDRMIEVLIQVNISGEEQKFGIDPDEINSILDQLHNFRKLHVRGLMTIAPMTEDRAVIRDCFKRTRLLRDEINQKYVDHPNIIMRDLSMGMSADYEIAIEEGSTMVRVGSAIFKGSN